MPSDTFQKGGKRMAVERQEAVLVLDCGATNLRAVVMAPDGTVLSQASTPNRVSVQPGESGHLVWDMDEIWSKLCSCIRDVLARTGSDHIAAVTVATWGADGAPVRPEGTLAYPVVSWKCPRTVPVAKRFSEQVSPWHVFEVTGYQVMSINTLFKLIWLREHAPRSLEKGNMWLMMPALVANRLGAKPHVEPTSASTTMAMSVPERDWSDEMLGYAGLDHTFFPPWVEPGEVVGEVSARASRQTGLKPGTPIVAGGHDTQFAIIGAGAKMDEAVLSSGTWEILAFRCDSFTPTRAGFDGGVMVEADVERGMWNPQILMMGSGVLEWIRSAFFGSSVDYSDMIASAQRVPPGSRGVCVLPSFVSDSGPNRRFGTMGTILGLGLNTSRDEIYRAALEGLSFQLRQSLEILTESTGIRPKGIRVVGGGSRNELWNRIRADTTGLPITTTSISEATVLGASLVAFRGIGRFRSLEAAVRSIDFGETTIRPGEHGETYEELYRQYLKVPPSLAGYYRDLKLGRD